MGTGKMDFLVSLWRFRAMRDTKKSTFPVPTGSLAQLPEGNGTGCRNIQ